MVSPSVVLSTQATPPDRDRGRRVVLGGLPGSVHLHVDRPNATRQRSGRGPGPESGLRSASRRTTPRTVRLPPYNVL